MNLEAIDIIFIIIISVFGLSGFKNGFFLQLFTIVGIVLGLFAAYFFSDDLAEVLVGVIGDNSWNVLLSFIVLFLGIYIICRLLNKAFKNSLEVLGAQGMDRIFGFLFGLVKGLVVCVALTALIAVQSVVDPEVILKDSVIGSKTSDFLPKIEKILPKSADFINNLEKEI